MIEEEPILSISIDCEAIDERDIGLRIQDRTPDEPQVYFESRDTQQITHPSSYAKNSRKYKLAVEEFFRLDVKPPTTSIAKRNSELVNQSLNYEDYDEKSFEQFTEENWDVLDRRNDLLENYVKSSNATNSRATLSDLRNAYKRFCDAVNEFELNASTLRVDSRALTLCKIIVSQSCSDIFEVQQDFCPSRRPSIPSRVKERLRGWERSKEKDWKIEYGRALHDFENHLGRIVPPRELTRKRVEDRERRRATAIELARAEAFGQGQKTEVLDPMPNDIQKRALENYLDELASQDSVGNWDFWLGDLEQVRSTQHRKDIEAFEREFEPGVWNALMHETVWGEGWLLKIRAEREWMKDDRKDYPTDWEEQTWLLHRLWYEDVEDWTKRRDMQMQDLNSFGNKCVDLLKELGKIDGCISSHEINIFNRYERTYNTERWHTLTDHIRGMKIAFCLGDEDAFLERCTSSFELINQSLVTLIRKQDHFRNTFMDSAAVAIFFSSITATTLQFSFTSANQSSSSTVVNLCWFASLVLSIASATNSFLGAIVHQSPEYLRSSQHPDYHFLQVWFRYVPPTLLTISGVLFLTGISAFTFLSSRTSPNPFPDQGTTVKTITASLIFANFLAVLIIFMLSFTKILHSAYSTTTSTLVEAKNFLIHLVFVLVLGSLALLVGPFITIYCLIRYKIFPPNYAFVLSPGWEQIDATHGHVVFGDFGKIGRVLHATFFKHLGELKNTKLCRITNKCMSPPTLYVYHLGVILSLGSLALIAIPFVTLYFYVRYGRRQNRGDLGSYGRAGYQSFDRHWVEFKKANQKFLSFVNRPIPFLFGHWRRLRGYIMTSLAGP
ncbi:hypothetical protein SCHPADRAFT_941838 [Schizopora paradoxa]|uniref:Uncharacterized protein n=1 Tax=Schizopora paradoxa TaxID=27342 RepID=A0A0H2RIR6_9AGAM|nr:hypothetical protein SCHPADRAFT_941838 [Schizopora paradoxa]